MKVVARQADAIIQDMVTNLGLEIQRLKPEKTLEIREKSSHRKYVYTDLRQRTAKGTK